jgi:hypothetical protein
MSAVPDPAPLKTISFSPAVLYFFVTVVLKVHYFVSRCGFLSYLPKNGLLLGESLCSAETGSSLRAKVIAV